MLREWHLYLSLISQMIQESKVHTESKKKHYKIPAVVTYNLIIGIKKKTFIIPIVTTDLTWRLFFRVKYPIDTPSRKRKRLFTEKIRSHRTSIYSLRFFKDVQSIVQIFRFNLENNRLIFLTINDTYFQIIDINTLCWNRNFQKCSNSFWKIYQKIIHEYQIYLYWNIF